MMVYHGSQNLFDSFDYNRIGENGRSEGNGFYFTDSLKVAETYGEKGGYIYEVEFSGKKPLSDKKVTITKGGLSKIFLALHESEDILSNYDDVDYYGIHSVLRKTLESTFEYCHNDVDIFVELCNVSGGTEEVARLFHKILGYDCIVIDNPTWGNQKIYIATVSDIIKIKKVFKN